MKRTTIFAGIVFVLAFCFAGFAMAQDPTLHEVYEAAQSGHFAEAQSMMDKVLKDHPTSGKAHFVEAELLARQGRYGEAQSELTTAERYNPGLTDEKPQAVQDLRALIGQGLGRNTGGSMQRAMPAAPARSGISLGLIVVVLAVIAFIVIVARAMGRRNQVVYGPTGPAIGGYGPGGQPMQPYGPGGYPVGPMGGGMGSGILGGLATGAAVGAGVVAGEELMHHFTDRGGVPGGEYVPQSQPMPPDNMGGADFGVNNPGTWDDGSSGSSWDSGSSGGGGGGDDWN